MRPRILYSAFDVVPSPKGASTHITQFTRGLVRAGYDLTLVTAGHHSLPELDSYCGAELRRPPNHDDGNFLRRALGFGDYVTAQLEGAEPPFALAHFRSIWSGFPLVEARPQFGCQLLYEVNGLPSIEMVFHYPELEGEPVLDKLRERELATLHAADAVICPAQVTRHYITSLGVPAQKVAVIPNGVDSDQFSPASPQSDPARLPTILYIGTLADWQGLDTLIAAMPSVLARQPVQLRIVGRGRKRQRKRLEKQIRRLDLESRVSIQDPVPHHLVPDIIRQATVCVAPLGYDQRNVTQGCCPIKILEYMACGRPIAASNLPAVRELLRPDLDGLLFKPDDPGDLSRCLLTLLENPDLGNRMGIAAADRAQTHFSWHLAQERLLDVYDQLLKNPVICAAHEDLSVD